jgi:hypothetical protein
MRRSERILDEEKNARRTIADAINVLHKHASFGEQNHAIIRVDALPLPSYQNVAQVHAVFENLPRDVTYFVWLPSASKFKARRDGRPGHEIFAIFELGGATIHSDGTVLLTDHRRLRAVEVVPELLPDDLTDLEWRILHRTIQYMGIGDRVYRSYWEGLDTHLQEGLPDQRGLDFSRLAGLDVPLLKQIQGYIEDNDTPARTPSPETIAVTLKKCGMRIPASRFRRRFERG